MEKYQLVVVILGTLSAFLVGSQAFTTYTQVYPPQPAAYGAATYGSYPSAGANPYGTCGSLKVTEVLDQIYCHHGYYTRFTSTDLSAIKVVLYQLGLVTKFAHINAVLAYVEQAIYFLEDMKDEAYKSYDTSQLTKYYQGAGPDYTDLQGYLTNATAALEEFEGIRKGYRKQFGMIDWGNFTPDPYATDYTPTEYGKDYGKDYPKEYKKKRGSPLGIHPSTSSRRTRADSEYDYAGDYTCAYISASYCSANSILVKNVAYRVLKAANSMIEALTILYDYIKNHDCGTDNDNKYALLVTADSFGSILTALNVLIEAVKYQLNIYTGMAGASGYSNNLYARAGGSGYNSPPPYQQYPSYGYGSPNPYRYQRAAVFPFTAPVRSDLVVVG